jgi:uncharacterized protein YneF (UPF0154 family)
VHWESVSTSPTSLYTAHAANKQTDTFITDFGDVVCAFHSHITRMASADEIVIIIMFVLSLLAFAILMFFVVTQWFKENPDKAPVKANKWIPLMNRQQILEAAELLDTADPMTS